jgi:hypothetical protein
VTVKELLPPPGQRCDFSYRRCKFVPATSGCYALTTFFTDILYIGLAVDLGRRIVEHLNSRDKPDLTPLGRAYWFYFCPVEQLRLPGVERGWLNQYELQHGTLPVLNKIHSPLG